jgi:hypothetical protein
MDKISPFDVKREGLSTSQLHKKTRLDSKKNDILQGILIQQLPPSQDSVHLQGQRQTLYTSVP